MGGHESVLREVVFAPVGGEGVAQQTVRRLAEGIALGLLQPGERLPPEVQLSKWLGISQLTLREALSVLRQAGYLETKRGNGGGSFVRRGPPPPSTAEARRALQDLTVHAVRDITDLRIAITGEASRLAARRADRTQVARIGDLAEQALMAKRYARYRQLDAAFHISISSASGSSRLLAAEVELQIELGKILTAAIRVLKGKLDPVARAANREHQALAVAIAEGDESRAQRIAEAHAEGTMNVQLALAAV